MMTLALSGNDTGDLDSHTGPQAMFGLFPLPGSFLRGLVLEQDSKQDDRWALERRVFVLPPQLSLKSLSWSREQKGPQAMVLKGLRLLRQKPRYLKSPYKYEL